MKPFVFLLSVFVAASAVAPAAPTNQALLAQLGGADPLARAQARQYLPYRDVHAVAPAVIALLAHEDQQVAWAAMRVVEDLANQTTAPGREDERHLVTDHLMALLAPGQPPAVVEMALRILPPIVPAAYSLEPVAALLHGEDPVLREKARAALHEIGTPGAATAIAAALDHVDPPFQAALLHSLAGMAHAHVLADARRLLRSPEAEVRAAACHALAWYPEGGHLREIEAVHEAMEGRLRFQTGLALLRQVDALMAAGGHWPRGMACLETLVLTETDAHVRAGAIVALGKYGDETAVARILAVLGGQDGRDFEPAALAAFEALRGAAGAHALRDAYPELSPGMQAALLRVFGSRRDGLFLDIMHDAATSGEPALAGAGFHALVDSGLPGAAEAVIARVNAASGEAQGEAIAALARLAGSYRDQGAAEAAGRAYATLYRVAGDDAQRAQALEGIRAFPVPDAYDIVMDALGDEAFATLPADALAGFARALHDGGDAGRALEIVEALLPRLDAPERVRASMGALAGIPGIRARLGVVYRYYLAGPGPWSASEGFGEPPFDVRAVDVGEPVSVGGGNVRDWTWFESDAADGLVPPEVVAGLCESCCIYAYTEVTVAGGGAAQVRAGSDDGLRIWVNGDEVLANNVDRGAAMDQEVAEVTLEPGLNRIVLQCTQNSGGWAFLLRLTGPDGAPLVFEPMSRPNAGNLGE